MSPGRPLRSSRSSAWNAGTALEVDAAGKDWYICTMLSWIYLTAAIVCEIVATVALKYVHGFTRPLPLVIVIVGYVLSFWALGLALRGLPLGLVYAVWSGVGTVAITIVGTLAFKESFGPITAASIIAIVVGVIGLNLASVQ